MSLTRRVVERIARVLPDRAPDALQQPRQYLGRPLDRLDGIEKVTGTARFSAEYEVEGLRHGALVFSTIAKGRIAHIHTAAAEQAPGVIAVFTHLNAPAMKPPAPFAVEGDPAAGSTNVAILNTDRIAWNGQPVAVVVADTEEHAEHAASLVTVTYEAEPAATAFEEAVTRAHKPKEVLGESAELLQGDPDEVLRRSEQRVDLAFSTPPHNHNAIEPHAAIAVWDDKERLTIYDTSQFTAGGANALAEIFGLKPGQVQLLAPFVGGGFGGKGTMWFYNQLCAMAAREIRQPVRIALSREGVFRIVGGRTPSQQRVAIAADADGAFTAFIHEGVTAQSQDNEFPEQFSFPPRHLYAMPAYRIGQQVTTLDRVANTFMRAPGESIGTFAVESAIDALSYELKIDPIALRLRNEPTTDPVSGRPFSSRHLREAYRLGAARFGWQSRPAAARTQARGPWLIGQGVATGTYPVYRMVTAVRIRLHDDGRVLVQTSCQEMGMGTATVQTQHVADRFGLPLDHVSFEYGDSTLPWAGVAGGSSQTISIARAIEDAATKLVQALLAVVVQDSPLKGAKPEDVQTTNAGLFLKERPSVGESYATLLRRASKPSLEVEVKTGAPLETLKYSMHSYAAQFCEAAVHAETGEVRIQRWVGAFDTGRILNPKTAVSQFRGGIIMGIGMALTEETMFDPRTGRIMNPSLAEYHIPVQADIPDIDIVYTDIPDPLTPLGAHGIGEIGITGVAAAVANAVFHATGTRVTQLPITLDKLLTTTGM